VQDAFIHLFIFIQEEAREKCCGDCRGGRKKTKRASVLKIKKLVGTYQSKFA